MTTSLTKTAVRKGNLQTRLYSVEFALPGKWTSVLEVDEHGMTTADSVDTTLLPSVGGSSWVMVRRELIRSEAHIGIYHYTYECAVEDPPKASTDTRGDEMRKSVISASVTLTRQPIGMHPNFPALKSKYGGRLLYGQWDWPAQDPTGQSKRSGSDKSGNPLTGINPMYGVQEYLSPSVTIRQSKMDLAFYGAPALDAKFGYGNNPPGDILQFFQIPTAETNSFSDPATGYNWLMTENTVRQHGASSEIIKGWQHGGIGGWNKIMYSDTDPS
jgi:hypothetical protein